MDGNVEDEVYYSEEEISDDHESATSSPIVGSTHLLCNKQGIISYRSIGVSEDLSEKKGNILSSIFTLVSTMIGGGLLSLPFAFQQGGFAMSSFALLFTLVTSTYGAFLIVNSKKYCHGRVKNIEDVARIAFGKKGQRMVEILLIGMLFLSSVAYMILITEQMTPIASLILGEHSIYNHKITLLTLVLVIVFPISLMKNLSALSFTSGLSVLCGLFLCICVTYRSAKSEFGGPVNKKYNPIVLLPNTVGGFINCISITEVGYSCHFNVLPMYDELRFQTRTNKRIILVTAMGLTYFMNLIVSSFGYLQFRKYTDQDITKNYPSTDNLLTCGRIAFCFVLLLSYPLIIVPCRATINRIIWPVRGIPLNYILCATNKELTGPNKLFWFLETIGLVGTSYVLAYLVPQVNMVWGIVGAVGCTSLIYILPAAFYLRVRRHPTKPDYKKIFAILLLFVGCLLLAVGVYQSVMNIVLPAKMEEFHLCNINSTTRAHLKCGRHF